MDERSYRASDAELRAWDTTYSADLIGEKRPRARGAFRCPVTGKLRVAMGAMWHWGRVWRLSAVELIPAELWPADAWKGHYDQKAKAPGPGFYSGMEIRLKGRLYVCGDTIRFIHADANSNGDSYRCPHTRDGVWPADAATARPVQMELAL